MPQMKLTRREFIQSSTQVSAAAMLGAEIGLGILTGCSSNDNNDNNASHPNILLIMVDQMQTPPEGYLAGEGVDQGLKEILGFRPLSAENAYTQFFPGMLRLRQNAVVLRKHYTASSACVPSRTCIMTGQYPSITGVDQTDGLFKTPHDVSFLDPDGIPTIGDWFRAVGYTTHYFGKWHVSEASADTQYLEPWGFSDWEKSYPDAHAGNAYNSGAFRDIGLAENVEAFLKKMSSDAPARPWFAVGSLLNPHDCSIWPINWQTPPNPAAPQGNGVVPWRAYPPPPPNPAMGDISLEGTVCPGTDHEKTITVALNPKDFPQNNSALPRTYAETLNDKPRCQKDYALKWGLAFAGNTDYGLIGKTPIRSPLPFQLQADPEAWSLGYNQFYFYLHYLLDIQIDKIFKALDGSGMAENTIIIFISDHGDMTGAHGGMIQKWHNAYEESIRVPMVISSPLVNKNKQEMREILQPTSSIDFAPTVLALAGYREKQVQCIMKHLHGDAAVKPFAGADLSAHIKGEKKGAVVGPDKNSREGVFFMSNDMITELGPSKAKQDQYDLFLEYVNQAIGAGKPLVQGPVRQPNHVRALCTGDWKIVHYIDPQGVEKDEWELYCLTADPIEQNNLVDFSTGEVRDGVPMPPGFTKEALKSKATELKAALAKQEAAVIG